jgi:hypothetical protein
MRRILPFVLGLAGLSTLFVTQSGAQTSTVKPAPSCAGIAASDSDKDGVSHAFGLGPAPSTQSAPENLEITRFWFDRSAGKTTANIEVKKLSKANMGQGTSISWYVTWTYEDAIKFVLANSDGDSVTYNYGTLVQSVYQQEGDTSGKFFDGDKGVVQLVIPGDIGGKVGAKIEDPFATTYENTDTGVLNSLAEDDSAPDEGGGKGWTVTDCGAGPTGPSGPGGQVVKPGALSVKASTALGSARKAAKTKRATVALTGEATKIEATLYKGSVTKPKVYGKGKLATLAGKGKLALKLAKKVKKGKYALTLIGTNTDGTRAEKSFKVKFKK